MTDMLPNFDQANSEDVSGLAIPSFARTYIELFCAPLLHALMARLVPPLADINLTGLLVMHLKLDGDKVGSQLGIAQVQIDTFGIEAPSTWPLTVAALENEKVLARIVVLGYGVDAEIAHHHAG